MTCTGRRIIQPDAHSHRPTLYPKEMGTASLAARKNSGRLRLGLAFSGRIRITPPSMDHATNILSDF